MSGWRSWLVVQNLTQRIREWRTRGELLAIQLRRICEKEEA